MVINSSSTIDQLTYTYIGNSNKLKNVIDGANSTTTTLGDFRSSSAYMAVLGTKTVANAANYTDYSYDVNGNLTTDKNKDITGITYNHLNLPSVITVTGKGTIQYVYDAVGNKLKKIVQETGKADKTTVYLFGTYQDEILQFLPQEEGRIRMKADASFVYDYFIKDHLGNVRMVLTEEQQLSVYQASIETANRAFEVALFGDKVNTTAANKPGGFDADGSNLQVSAVNGTTAEGRVGPGVILKVMAGDKFKAKSQAWYQPTGMDNTTDNTLQNILLNLLTQATNGVVSAGKGSIAAQVTGSNLQGGMQQLLSSQAPTAGAPKAYLNWILFDEKKFSKVAGGFVPIPSITGTTQKQLLQVNSGNDVQITQNGYLYVYVSNESKRNVYFDDIRIDHTKGPLLEETHYYPFGLTMSGISSKAAGSLTNKYKFGGKELNSNEFSDNSGLETYDFGARNYDQQVGRWWSGDPKADKLMSVSPYSYALNNPIVYVDPDGKYPWTFHVNSFIAAPTTGGGFFRGDGRGPSTSTNPREVTSRVKSAFTFDTDKRAVTSQSTSSDYTMFYGAAGANAGLGFNLVSMVAEGSPHMSAHTVSNLKNKNSGDTYSQIQFNHSGKDPITPEFVTPSLDVHGNLIVSENKDKGTLSITGSFTGDAFPSSEAYIDDQGKGKSQQRLLLGASQESGGILDLFGDNKESLFKVDMTVTFDNKGRFTGVKQGDKTYSVDEWNKKVKSEFGVNK